METCTQFSSPLKIIRTDNAQEYTSRTFTNLCTEFNIINQTSCAYTPQQNGVAERKNRHLLDVTRSLMLQIQVPTSFWNFAVSAACHLINCMTTSVLGFAIPFSLLFPSQSPFTLTPHVFGCTCYVHSLGPTTDKLVPRASKCMFLGYSRTQKGYLCYSPTTDKVIVSVNVTFRENQPFYYSSSNSAPFTSIPCPTVLVTSSLPPLIPTPLSAPMPPLPPKPPLLRVYTRRASASGALQQPSYTGDIPWTGDSASTSTAHPMANYVSMHRLWLPLRKFALSLSLSLSFVSIPNSVQDIFLHLGWRVAMEEEMTALWSNQTWDLVLPSGQSCVSCKWVFAIKHAPDGTVDMLKARLVARAFTQQPGLDYDETFSPVAKLNSVRVLISLVIHRHWPLHQLDIKNAFLNDDLQETVYMNQPPGFETMGESRVCYLRKSIYGLKQSPKAWFDKFSKAVREVGFKSSSTDFSLFTRHQPTGIVILLVYVDDILIIDDDSIGMQQIKKHLNSIFQTKDLGALRYFLGLEVARRPDGLVLSQRKYCLDLFHNAGYSGCKSVETLMDANHKLCAHRPDSDSLLTNRVLSAPCREIDISDSYKT
ncbi:hypothetical protein KSP39_PZI021501 [Platanthera zijinensis]|uniref:Integrase catalytic domain-containing protein n=1 Tax=Platanthera zijinensis TaxID=2320716 RepID=A0AAP0FW37_9ASPA